MRPEFAPAVALLTAGCVSSAAAFPNRTCPGGFEGTFIQLGERELEFDRDRWREEMELLRSVGVRLVILQFSGDQDGAYDGRRPNRTPVRALLTAAGEAGVKVFLGLHADPGWPHGGALEGRVAPPLDDPRATGALGELCRRAPACTGWYIPQEIEPGTWSSAERTRALRAYLFHTSETLRGMAPGRPVAIAPFFTGKLEPTEHARWWRSVVTGGVVDIVILQDGVGTRRANASVAREYLLAMRRALQKADGVRVWSVVELFWQTRGPPVEPGPFAAVPIEPSVLKGSLEAERRTVERMVAFSVLDYMSPKKGPTARRLYNWYVAWCSTNQAFATE